jgi:hypothetical protein
LPETLTIERGQVISYRGYFNPKDLYMIIQKIFKQNSYDWSEYKNVEQNFSDHLQIEWDLRPYKKLSDYVKVELRVDVTGTNLKLKEIEVDGVKKKLHEGNLTIMLRAFMITDYEQTWETKPFYFWLRMLADKFIFKSYTERAKGELQGVISEVREEIRSFLNMGRYNVDATHGTTGKDHSTHYR